MLNKRSQPGTFLCSVMNLSVFGKMWRSIFESLTSCIHLQQIKYSTIATHSQVDTTHQKGFRYAREFFMPQNQNHSRFVNRLIFLRYWYIWDLHLILHLRLKFSLNLLRLLRGEGEFGRLGLVSSRADKEVCSPNLPMLTSSAPFHAELKSTTKLQLHAASLLPLCPACFGLFRSCANSSKTSHSDASTSH